MSGSVLLRPDRAPQLPSLHSEIFAHHLIPTRLIVACCLSDLMRIYAPNAPYDDAQLHVCLRTHLSASRASNIVKAQCRRTFLSFLFPNALALRASMVPRTIGTSISLNGALAAFDIRASGCSPKPCVMQSHALPTGCRLALARSFVLMPEIADDLVCRTFEIF